MSENLLQWIAVGKLVWLASFAGLYGFGGIKGKWKRRYLGSFCLTLGVVLFSILGGSFSWWLLLYFPLLTASLSIGYGGTRTSEKIIKRGRYALAVSCASLPIAIITGMWALFALHILLNLIVIVSLGTWNFSGNSRHEESIMGFTIGFLPLFMV